MRHVSAETMARFRQGDLNERRSTQIGTHLASCDRCSALNGDLGRVTTLLASTPQPRMADDVTARIQAALAAEAAARSANHVAKAPARRARTWWPQLPRISSPMMLRGLAAAGAVVLLAGGGYAIVAGTGLFSASGNGAAESGQVRPVAGAAGSGVMAPAHVAGPTLQYRHGVREASITPITTDTNFTRANLARQASAAVVSYGRGFTMTGPNAAGANDHGSAASLPGAAQQTVNSGTMATPMLRGCVNRMDAGGMVLLVDVARYQGAPATVIVTEAAVTGPMQIWVVGADCSASRSDMLAHAMAATP
jgi:hypothetical protein